jgi:hypothetical protein
LVFRDDQDRIWEFFQLGALLFQSPDNCEKFFVINHIIDIGWGMLLGEISHRVKNIIIIIL